MSLPSDFFYDEQHASNYLVESWVRYKKVPVRVVSVSRHRREFFAVISCTDGNDQVPLSELDLSPMPMGLCNWGRGGRITVVSVTRMHSRQWKIGACRNNINWKCSYPDDQPGASTLLQSKSFADMVADNYPSYGEVWKDGTSADHRFCRAFCRGFAISINYGDFRVLNRRLQPIGIPFPEGVKLDPEYHYLAQLIEQARVQCLF